MNSKIEKAEFFLNKGKYSKVKSLCLGVRKRDKNNIEAILLLANACLKSGEYMQAIKIFNEAISINSNLADCFSGLGWAYFNLENFDSAEESFNTALSLNSAHSDANIGAARICIKKSKSSEAEKRLLRVLEQYPENEESLFQLGQIKLKANDFEKASALFEKLLKINPKHTSALYSNAHVAKAQGYIEKAIVLLKKIVALDAKYPAVYLELGDLLIISSLFKEAVETFKKHLKLKKESPAATAGIAAALNGLGEYDNAHKYLKPFLEKNVLHPGIAKAYVKICRKINLCEDAIKYMEQVINMPDIENHNKISMHYLMAKIHDEESQFEQAFVHCKKANELRPDNYSAIEYNAMIRAIINVFMQRSLSSLPRANIETHKPIFIIGMPRSGTSLVEQILSCHGDVFAAGELRTISDEIKKLGSNLRYPQCVNEITQEMLKSAANNYISHIENIASGEIRVTDKMPHNFLYLGIISLMFPNAKIIHCMRDPRDICLSIYFQNFHSSHSYATRLENIVQHYKDYETLMNFWKSVLDVKILNVQYENLVKNQEDVSKKIVEYIDLPWDEKCLDFYKQDRAVVTSSQNQVNKKMYTSSIEKWKNYNSFLSCTYERLGI